jgi:hypothetical protein
VRFLARLEAAEKNLQPQGHTDADLQQLGRVLVRRLERLPAQERGEILARWPDLVHLQERLAALRKPARSRRRLMRGTKIDREPSETG